MAANRKSTSQEVERSFPTIATEALAEITSFEQAVELARNVYGNENVVAAADVLGDGFKLTENKDSLIGVPFFALSWAFTMGDHGEYVAVKAITRDGMKVVITDGSKGIYEMLVHYTKQTGRYGGLFCAKGLRRSDYTYIDDNEEEKSARTYYLDTAAAS